MNKRIVIHYSEIGLKGKNRKYFENALVDNIRKALGPLADSVRNRYGRIVCHPAENADPEAIRLRLQRLPGIAHFSFGEATEPELNAIEARALEVLKEQRFKTFGVKTRRADKSFPLTSAQINTRLGAHILKHIPDIEVDLTAPDVRLFVELTSREAFLYANRFPGPGGLPVGTSGRVLASVSGGIDSPVAASMMMKRGCEVVFVHIHNETQFASGAMRKIESLVHRLSGMQGQAKLYTVPFGELQRAIIAFVPAKLRMIVYRRFMMRILGHLAERENAKALVTGDSVGQVASQTLDNLHCIQAAAPLPVLSPLIGLNKEEIVAIARNVGTYEHSIEPYPDCCSFMIAPHPETRADLQEIERFEAGMSEVTGDLLDACVAEAEVRVFEPGEHL